MTFGTSDGWATSELLIVSSRFKLYVVFVILVNRDFEIKTDYSCICALESKPWMDKLRVLHKMASERGSSAKIFKAIADPPTTSLQRLKVISFWLFQIRCLSFYI